MNRMLFASAVRMVFHCCLLISLPWPALFPHLSLHPLLSGSFLLPQTLNKNNLIPDDRANFYPLQQTNVYTTTYYPSPLNKHSFRPEASPGQRCFPNS